MTRYVDMRGKFEEERSALEQLKELLDEIESGESGRETGKAVLAASIIDLRKALGKLCCFQAGTELRN